MCYIQVKTLILNYLSFNQELIVKQLMKDGRGEDFIYVTDGDDSCPKFLDTETIYTVDEVLNFSPNTKFVCAIDSTAAKRFRELGYNESKAYWNNERQFVKETTDG